MSLAPRWILNGLDLTAAPFLVEANAADHGAPESVRNVLASMLADGDIDLIDRHGNRTFEIPVLLEGSLDEVAAAEAALVASVLPERGTLVFEPGDGTAQASTFETFAGDLVLPQSEDADDAGLRRAVITIPCRPFARPDAEVTIDAPAVTGSTTTNVDSGSATTGWSLLSTAPTALKNLETNPEFASNVTGYSAGTGASTPTYSTLYSRTSAEIQSNVAGNAVNAKTELNGPLHTVTPGKVVVIGSVTQTGASAPFMTAGARVRFYSDTGGTVQVGSDQTLTGTGGAFVTRTWTVTVPATAIRMRVYRFKQNLSSQTASPWYLDKQWTVIGDNGAVVSYFDGATTNTVAIAYTWDGTANNSTSTGTWTAPTLAVVSGAVKGTVYGQSSASIRRNNTSITGAAMASLPYMRIKGTATASSDGQITISDNGGSAITPTSYSYNKTTGVFEILVNRPGGFTNLDVTYSRSGGFISTTYGLFIAVDSIDITDNPFNTGKVQSRQVQIYGSQRTELSLSVLGLDAAGTTPVGLGEQVLIHTAAAGEDGRAKFLACRQTTSLAGTSDATAVSGAYNTPGTSGSPTAFTIPASALLNGNYLVAARIRCATVGSLEVAYRAICIPTTGDRVNDPATGWKSTFVTVVASGAVWPQINQATGSPAAPWAIVPLGMLRLPPADVQDDAANIGVHIFRAGVATAFDVDEVFLLNADAGQASILVTGITTGGSYSAVRLDAATVDAPQASAWLGVANGTMIADPTRWVGEQHQAAPGLLQVSTVTPGCTTSRVSAHYYPRFHTHVANLGA